MSDGHCFISYSNAESEKDTIKFAFKLADKLKAGPPSIDIWIDNRSIRVGDWDEQVSNAIKTCKCFLFLISPDSVSEGSICTDEWNWAIKYKKPIIPLILQKEVEVPFRLSRRNFIDFTGNFETALSKLRNHIDWLDSPEGFLQGLRDRLADEQRDLHRTSGEDDRRIQADIDDLKVEIMRLEEIIRNPKDVNKNTIKKDEGLNLARPFDVHKKLTIFICYRRSDSADVSGRIYDRLSGAFGKKSVFKDVDSIPFGIDYREVLRESVSQCNIFLVVIGKYWLKTEQGEQRLTITNDFVRFEIETALQRNIPVIPLLVNEAKIPLESDLPKNLHPLIYRNGMAIRSDPDFHTDINRLIRNINSKTE